MLVKSELERSLDRERRELSDTKSQLRLLQDGMQQWEQDHFNTRNTSVKKKLQLESLIEERNSLREQVKNLEVKINPF